VASSSLPILIFLFKNCFNDVSLAVREFSLTFDFSSWWLTNQNWPSWLIDQSGLIVSSTRKIESLIFSNFTIFREISNEKTHRANVFFLNVWNSFANELLKCWNLANLVFIFCFRVKWTSRFFGHYRLVNRGSLIVNHSLDRGWCRYLATAKESWMGFV